MTIEFFWAPSLVSGPNATGVGPPASAGTTKTSVKFLKPTVVPKIPTAEGVSVEMPTEGPGTLCVYTPGGTYVEKFGAVMSSSSFSGLPNTTRCYCQIPLPSLGNELSGAPVTLVRVAPTWISERVVKTTPG